MSRLAAALLAALNRHRVPAAPDNQPGTDADALWTCRRIATSRQEGQ